MSILKPESIVFTFNLFIFSSEILVPEKFEVDILKAVLIFLPIVFSQARGSAAALDLLGAGSFSFNPRLQTRFPQENWGRLFSASYEACNLAIATAPEGDNMIAIAMEGASGKKRRRDDLAPSGTSKKKKVITDVLSDHVGY